MADYRDHEGEAKRDKDKVVRMQQKVSDLAGQLSSSGIPREHAVAIVELVLSQTEDRYDVYLYERAKEQ